MRNNVPKLRFKGFNDEWNENRIDSLFDVYAGGDISKNHLSEYNDKVFKYPVYSNSLDNMGLYGYSDIYKFDGETITVTGRGVNVGVANARYNEYFPIVRLLVLNPKEILNVKLFEEVINNMKIFIESTGVPQLTGPQISKIRIKYPSLKEQDRIANFLTKVDKIIEKQSEKVNNLENYKKGMMQKIFSQEIRFKDENGEEYQAWGYKSLSEIANITMGQSPSSESYNEEMIGLPLIQGNADIKNRKTMPRIFTSSITKTCNENDIIMSVRAPVGSIAKSVHRGCIGRGVCAISAKLDLEYLYQLLLMQEDKWIKISQGSTFDSINRTDIESLKFKVPCLKEQIRIGDFLSNIDLVVDKEKEKLEELRQWKKGLLQQMFV